MEAAKISVIVPVYKAEAYLEKCINSIREQTYHNLEIILVDDGSPDNCGMICEKFAREDPRIRVIHQENAGQATARNVGLDVITGDFVGFVDSDDWVEPQMYETLLCLMKEHHTKIGACGMRTNQGFSYNREYPRNKNIEVFSQREALIEVTKNQKVTNSICDKLWSREIFETIHFPDGEYFEDMKVVYKCLEKAESVVYDPTPYYIYRMTEESTTRGNFQPRMMGDVYAAKSRADHYLQNYPAIHDYAVASYIQICLMQIWNSRNAAWCSEERKDLIATVRSPLSAGTIRCLNTNNKIKLYTLRMGLPFYYFVMKINDCVNKVGAVKKNIRLKDG